MSQKTRLHSLFDAELRRAGIAPDIIFKDAQEIIVFGSRAAGCASKESDLDVLCIGGGPRVRSPFLDLLWVTNEMLRDPEWLGSELANHIAAFGVWLKGDGDWARKVFVSRRSVDRKRARIRRQVEALKQYWEYLSPATRRRFLNELRIEMRRLWHLRQSLAVPPAALLDWPGNSGHQTPLR